MKETKPMIGEDQYTFLSLKKLVYLIALSIVTILFKAQILHWRDWKRNYWLVTVVSKAILIDKSIKEVQLNAIHLIAHKLCRLKTLVLNSSDVNPKEELYMPVHWI